MLIKQLRVSIWFLLPLLIFACKKESEVGIKDLAANEDVANFMENYKGRGVLTDSLATPTAPEDVLKDFTIPEDLSLELVLSEPEIVQPIQVSFDHKGRMWVVQYQQYPYPKGLKITAIDNHTRVKFDK